MLGASFFGWTFLGTSLALCTWFMPQYTEGQSGILRLILGSSLLSSLSISAGMFVIAQRFAVPRMMTSITREAQFSNLKSSFDSLAKNMGVEASLREASIGTAFSLSHGGDNIVALSADIARSLSGEETEAVLAHELSHIKNKDALAKGLARIAHLAFPFDPVIRMVEAAIHRERELLADSVSATFTGKPLALASALLKACSAQHSEGPRLATGLCVGGTKKGLLNLYPDLEKRIDVLVELSKRLSLPEAPILAS